MPSSILLDRDVPMTTRDGVTLRSDIYRPADNGRYPAIVIRTPYNKALSGSNDIFRAPEAAFKGYVVVIQDARGRFSSEGEFGRRDVEGPDGYDAIEWVASQPWCNGQVGTSGGSYLASAQWQAAVLKPPSLKAIAPAIGASGAGSSGFTGGAFSLDTTVSWFPFMAVDVLAKLESQGKATPEMRDAVYRAVFHIEDLYDCLPLKDLKNRFPGMPGSMFRSMEILSPDAPEVSQTPDEYSWEDVLVPGLHVGGWYDLFTGGTLTCFQRMRTKGGSPVAKSGQHMVMGPWSHGGILPAIVGAVNFGPQASASAGTIHDHHMRFYDKYVRGVDVDLPAVRYFVMGANRWYDAEDWPLPETDWQRFYLHSSGRANTLAGDGTLSSEAPAEESPDIYVYDPHSPVPTLGGRNLGSGRLVLGPHDQSSLERRNDVLVYSTEPLKSDLEVTGPLRLHLFAATSARDTDFVAKLTDVYPDCRSFNLAEGIIRARFWKSMTQPDLVKPGEVREYIVDLVATSNLFRKGHRIRLDIASSNFPRFDRNMNTGNPIGEDAEGIHAQQTILHSRAQASYIDLPVIPAHR